MLISLGCNNAVPLIPGEATENITFGGFSAARASAGDAMCYAVPCDMLCHVLA
jgi:hypothetical protein